MSVESKMLINIFDSTRPASDFFDWLEGNKEGYFVNTFQEMSERYVKLHSARCGIATSNKRYGPAGATQRDYKKICSRSPDALIDYVVNKKGVPFEKVVPCKKCSAQELELFSSEASPLGELILTTDETLDEEGRKKIVTHYAIERSQRNRRIVLKDRSEPYVCDACELSLNVYGPEYGAVIHVHHKQPVGQGVRNPTKEDFLLLCPNCHAVAHWGCATKPLGLVELRKRAAAVRAKWMNK